MYQNACHVIAGEEHHNEDYISDTMPVGTCLTALPARVLRSSQRVEDELSFTTRSVTNTTPMIGLGRGTEGMRSITPFLTLSTGPIGVKEPKVRNRSSSKRKEQNRVAQRAFRKRQKTYLSELERTVGEKSKKIQVIAKSSAYFVGVLQGLQAENMELRKAGRLVMTDTMADVVTFRRTLHDVNGDGPSMDLVVSALSDKCKSKRPDCCSPNKVAERSRSISGLAIQVDLSVGPTMRETKNEDGPVDPLSPLKGVNPSSWDERKLGPYVGQRTGGGFTRPSILSLPTSMSTSISCSTWPYQGPDRSSCHNSEVRSTFDSAVYFNSFNPFAFSNTGPQGGERAAGPATASEGFDTYKTLVRDLQAIHSEQEVVRNRASRKATASGIAIRDFLSEASNQGQGYNLENQAMVKKRKRQEVRTERRDMLLRTPQQSHHHELQQQQGQVVPELKAVVRTGEGLFDIDRSIGIDRSSGIDDSAWLNAGEWAPTSLGDTRKRGQLESFHYEQAIVPKLEMLPFDPREQHSQTSVPVMAVARLTSQDGWVPEGLKSHACGRAMPFTGVLTPAGDTDPDGYVWSKSPSASSFSTDGSPDDDHSLISFGQMNSHYLG